VVWETPSSLVDWPEPMAKPAGIALYPWPWVSLSWPPAGRLYMRQRAITRTFEVMRSAPHAWAWNSALIVSG
jgi:hypothetical protein